MLTTMLVALLATAPDGTKTEAYGPTCWMVAAAPRSVFSVYTRGPAQLVIRDRHGWWLSRWDEGLSHSTSAWARLAVGVPPSAAEVCLLMPRDGARWGAMLERRMSRQSTNQLLRSDELPGAWAACFSSDPAACR